MATANNHLLQKVTFEIGLAKQEGAFEIQNRISNVFQSLIMRELERLFDARAGNERVISIDKLEIDLGNISLAHLEADVEKAFLRQMEDFMAALSAEVENAVAADEKIVRDVQVRWSNNTKANVETRITLTDSATSHFDKLTQLLLFGVCATNSGKTGVGKIADLLHQVLELQPTQLARFILQNKNKPQLLQRLALNLTSPQLTYVLSLLGCRDAAVLADTIHDAAELLMRLGLKVHNLSLPSNLHFQDAGRFLWWLLLVKFTGAGIAGTANVRSTDARSTDVRSTDAHSADTRSGNERSADVSAFSSDGGAGSTATAAVPFRADRVEDIITELFFVAEQLNVQPLFETKAKLQKAMRAYQFSPVVELAIKQVLLRFKDDTVRSRSHDESPIITPADRREQVVLKDNSGLLKNSLFTLPEKQGDAVNAISAPDEIPGADTGIYINNAGLVLLAPFLKPFFTNLGLVQGKDFVSQEARWKAAHLLQAACGFLPNEDGSTYGEADMVLNKLFCGIEIQETIPETYELSASETEEIESLLKSILQHWTIMSRSSVHALQSTFLQKQGRLSITGKDWDLLIERDSAVEILIDRLPWTIGFIKLPWCDYAITTTW